MNEPGLANSSSMKLELKEFQPTEYERFAQIRNSIFSESETSAQELRSFDDNLDRTKYYLQRYSCFDRGTGAIVGLGDLRHMPWTFHSQKFQGRIWVEKDRQNMGIGQFIYENLMKLAMDLRALEVWGAVKEDMPLSIVFLAKRGFKERERTWESTLNPATVSLSEFSHYLEKASDAGIEVSSLSQELELDPECYRKLYELNQTLMADVPGPSPYTPVSYEQWISFDMKDPGLLPDGYMIAKDGPDYVGLSSVRRLDREPRGLHQVLTGTRREYRRKGIAFALKLKVVEYAQKKGYDRIRTENSTLNAQMLGINTKLGFQRQVGWIGFSKTFA